MNDTTNPLMPYLHVPMQSGCDKILGLMKRKYSLNEMKEFFQEVISKFRNLHCTDLMTGFPGEEMIFRKPAKHFSGAIFILPCFTTLNEMEQHLRDYRIKCPWKFVEKEATKFIRFEENSWHQNQIGKVSMFLSRIQRMGCTLATRRIT